MNSITLQSPSKLNLYLKILGRRPDGFHRMVTLFHRISFADTMTLRKKKPGTFVLSCSDPRIPKGEANLITRTYRALEREIKGDLGGVSVQLKKRIPMGAGLGGGSSNAATFLLGMKKLYGLKLSKSQMRQIGRGLGADVPFFLEETAQALGTDRGDRLQKRPCKGRLWFLLVLSNKGLSTKKVFSKLPRKLPRPSLTKAEEAVRICCNFLKAKDLQQLPSVLLNDLEVPAFQLRPSLRKIIKTFESHGILTSRMSGSGATIFAIFPNAQQAQHWARKLRNRLPSKKLVVCHTH